MEIIFEDTPAMYVISPQGPISAADSFKKLEDAINWQLKGRKFYGTMLNGEYRANLAIVEGEDPNKLGFPVWIIPGGKYYREKISDWEKHVSEIESKFKEIINKSNYDTTRPLIEYYRSQAELFILVPIK